MGTLASESWLLHDSSEFRLFSTPMHIQIGLLQPRSLNMQQSIMDLMGFEKLWFSLVIGECTEDVMDTACSVDISSNHMLHSASVGEVWQ